MTDEPRTVECDCECHYEGSDMDPFDCDACDGTGRRKVDEETA